MCLLGVGVAGGAGRRGRVHLSVPNFLCQPQTSADTCFCVNYKYLVQNAIVEKLLMAFFLCCDAHPISKKTFCIFTYFGAA